MPSINRVILAGNVTRDPETRYIGYGTPVTEFAIAIDRRRAKREGTTDFVEITAWGKLARACDTYLRKGAPVLVEGELRTRTYEKNGETRRVTEVVIHALEFLAPKPDGAAESAVSGEHADCGDERSS